MLPSDQHDWGSSLDFLMRIGLADRPRESYVFTDEPKRLLNFLCLPNDDARRRLRCEGVYGHGSGMSEDEAGVRAAGEFYERLCLENPDQSKIVNGSFAEGECEDPRLFACYSEGQYGNRGEHLARLLRSKLDWYPAYDALNQRATRIPASLVFLYPDFREECEVRREQISTGAAFRRKDGSGAAFESGLLEAVERDAFMTAYLTRREVARVYDFPPHIQELLEYFDRYELYPHVFDITTDLSVPTFMTITLDRTGVGPAVNIGASSAYRYEDAIYDSIKESVQARGTSRFLWHMRKGVRVGEIRTLQDRYYYWYGTDMIRHLDFWLGGDKRIRFSNLPEYSKSVEDTKSVLAEAGFHVYAADMSVAEVSGAGFEAVKVVVPELHPLYLDERAKSLYSAHAGTVPDDNSLKPHPFT